MSDPAQRGRRTRFAANLERLRRQRGVSIEELAERSQLEVASLEAIIGGEAEARVETLYRLAGALEVEPGSLLEGVTWVPDGHGGEYRVTETSPDD